MSPVAAIARFGHESRCLFRVAGRSLLALPRARPAALLIELWRVALSALPLVGVASLFAGMVIALQTAIQLARLGSGHLVPDIVSVSLVRELGPVFTALLMAGKAGAGVASELGMIVLTGQDKAMRALSLDIDRELIAPRLFACVVGMLLLTMAAILLGLLGGMLLGSAQLGLTPVHYLNRAVHALTPADFLTGLVKAGAFGALIGLLGTSYGLRKKADAGEVGRHTMNAVVMASFWVLVSDHILTSLVTAVWG
jgi:phospholipid/cholesterol/gamma-HCH transport system permease protein